MRGRKRVRLNLRSAFRLSINRQRKTSITLGQGTLSLSHVCLFGTLWTTAPLAPLSIGFPRQEYWSGLQFLLQRIFLTQGSNLHLLHCKRILYLLSHLGNPKECQRGREFYVINTKRDSESIPWAESKGSGESVVEGK